MPELLTSAQMREVERAAIDSGAVTGLELMERAGQGVVEAIFEEWPELDRVKRTNREADLSDSPQSSGEDGIARSAVVLCGPGNNGGDGFVVARHLLERGWDVEVFFYGAPEKLPPDARVNFERWSKIGVVRPMRPDETKHRKRFDVLVDSLLGAGLSRPLPEDLLEFVAWIQYNEVNGASRFGHKTVAVDCPSCIDLDSGQPLLPTRMWIGDLHWDFLADLTVTFHALKLGHVLNGSHETFSNFSRKVVVKDIGLRRQDVIAALGEGESDEEREEICRRRTVNLLTRKQFSRESRSGSPLLKYQGGHKFHHGHALVLSGGAGRTGAARLSARAALRVGAGLVTLGVPGSAQLEVASQITAIMLTRVDEADALSEVLEDRRINALCLGPGLGVDRAAALIPAALTADHAPRVVLDADALTALAWDEALFELLHEGCVLTPHSGEFARLFPDIAARLAEPAKRGPAFSKLDATREAAARAGCTVLFKGPDSVIASPDGRAAINSAAYDRAAPWLATAGAGDVLAGMICGLLARGQAPQQSAEAAAWLHVEAARSFGPGLVAEDLPDLLPGVLRTLGA